MVYFIQGEQTKRIKIGKADDVAVRLQTLQCGSPDRLTVLKVLMGESNDRAYHCQFRDDHVYGEWFSASGALLGFIAGVPASRFDGLTWLPSDRPAVKASASNGRREYPPAHDPRQLIGLSARLRRISGLDAYLGRTSMTTNAW